MSSAACAAAELAAFEAAEKAHQVLPDINRFLSKYKVLNCMTHIVNIMSASSYKTAIHSVMCLLELYDSFWIIPESISENFKELIYYLVKNTPQYFSELKTFFKSFGKRVPKQRPYHHNDVTIDGTDRSLTNQSLGDNPVTAFLSNWLMGDIGFKEGIRSTLAASGGKGVVVIGWIAALVAIFSGGSAMFESKSVSAMAKTISNLGSTIKGLESVHKGFTWIVDFVVDKVSEILDIEVEKPKTSRDKLVDKILALANDLRTKVDEFKRDPSSWLSSVKKISSLAKSFEEVELLYEELARTTENMATIQSVMIEMRSNIAKVRDFYDTVVNSMIGKIIPTTLYLYGESGIGKSKLAEHISKLLVDKPDEINSVYTRNPTDPFWSAYAGQTVVVYDDFNQNTDNTDHAELIAIYTGATFLPRFADVKDKGKPFVSPYLILCSNTASVEKSKMVNIVEALDRRRDFVFKVRNPLYEQAVHENRKKEWRKKHCFNPDFSHLTFQEMNDVRTDGELLPVEDGMTTLYQIVAAMKTEYKERNDEYQARVAEKMRAVAQADFNFLDEGIVRLIQEAEETLRRRRATPTAPPSLHNSSSSGDSMTLSEAERIHGRPLQNQSKDSFHRHNPILLIGNPGIGKTELCKQTQLPVFDEFTLHDQTFLKVVELVWSCYDGKIDQIVLTCNWTTLHGMFLKHFPNDPDKEEAFLRRCEVFDFTWRYRSRYWYSKFSKTDLANGEYSYDDLVKIEWKPTVGEKKEITKAFLTDILRRGLRARNDVQVSDQLEELDCVCDLEIAINLTEEQILAPSFRVSITDVPSLIQPLKGNVLPHISKLWKLASLFTKSTGGLETSFMAFNDMQIEAEEMVETVGITFKDKQRFVCVPVEGYLKVFRAPHIFEEIDLADEEARKLKLERFKREDPGKFTIFQFFDVVSFVLKLGGSFVSLYGYAQDRFEDQENAKSTQRQKNIRRLRESLLDGSEDCVDAYKHITNKVKVERSKKDLREVLKEEGLDYDDIDELFDDWEAYSNTPHPKSHMNNIRKDEYCAIHHKMDRCWIMIDEASRRPLMAAYESIQRRGEPEDKSFLIESADELLHLKKKNVNRHPIDESADELLHLKKKKNKSVHPVDESKKKKRLYSTPQNPKSLREDKLDRGVIGIASSEKDVLENQSLLDPGAVLQGHKVFKNQLVAKRSDGTVFNRALMLQGHVGIINNHAVKTSKNVIVSDGQNDWNARIFSRDERKDQAFFQLCKQAPMFADITNFLCSKSKLQSVQKRHGILITPTRTKDVCYGSWKAIMLEDVTERQIESVMRYGLDYHGHSLGVTYEIAPIGTTGGDCGSAILLNDPQVPKKLIGIHSAGSDYYGFGCIITIEDVQNAIKNIANESLPDVEIKVLKHQQINTEMVEGDFCGMPIFGVTADGDHINKQFVPETTKFHDSPYAFDEKFGHCFEPAVMSEKDKRCTEGAMPYADSIKKWSNPQPEIDENVLNLARDEIGHYLAQKVKASGFRCSVLTKTEAINGVGGTPGSNPIYRQSSAGYPFKHKLGVQKKSAYFKQNDETMLQEIADNDLGKSLHHAIDSLICCAKEGKRPAVVFCSALKDEPLKLKKIYEVTKTRTFAASPIDYTIASRMYFHGAASCLTSIFHRIPIKIGINPAGTDFHDLYTYHAKVSNYGFDGDFANWDGSIPKAFMVAAGEIYNIIYQQCDPKWKKEDDVIRRNLHACVEGPLINYKEYVLQAPGGNPSGQPQTTLDNCLCNYMLGYYVFVKLMRKAGLDYSFTAFLKYVAPSYFGDDNIYTVAPEIMHIFNFVTFKEEAEKIGFTLTNAAKDGKELKLMKLTDLEFLKRNFVKIDGRYYGALVDASIAKMLAYCKHKAHFYDRDIGKISFDRKTIADTVTACLMECALKGEDFYNEVAEHIKKCNLKYHIDANVPSFASAQAQVLYEGMSDLTEVFQTNMKRELQNQSKEISNTQKYTCEFLIGPPTDRKKIICNKGHCGLPPLRVVEEEAYPRTFIKPKGKARVLAKKDPTIVEEWTRHFKERITSPRFGGKSDPKPLNLDYVFNCLEEIAVEEEDNKAYETEAGTKPVSYLDAVIGKYPEPVITAEIVRDQVPKDFHGRLRASAEEFFPQNELDLEEDLETEELEAEYQFELNELQDEWNEDPANWWRPTKEDEERTAKLRENLHKFYTRNLKAFLVDFYDSNSESDLSETDTDGNDSDWETDVEEELESESGVKVIAKNSEWIEWSDIEEPLEVVEEEEEPESIPDYSPPTYYETLIYSIVEQLQNGRPTNDSNGSSAGDDERLNTGNTEYGVRTRNTPTTSRDGSVPTRDTSERARPIHQDPVYSRFHNPVEFYAARRNFVVSETNPSFSDEYDSSLSDETVQLLEGGDGVQGVFSGVRFQCRKIGDIQTTPKCEARVSPEPERLVSVPIRLRGCESDGSRGAHRQRPVEYNVSLEPTKPKRSQYFWWVFLLSCYGTLKRIFTRKLINKCANIQPNWSELCVRPDTATKGGHSSSSRSVQPVVSKRGCAITQRTDMSINRSSDCSPPIHGNPVCSGTTGRKANASNSRLDRFRSSLMELQGFCKRFLQSKRRLFHVQLRNNSKSIKNGKPTSGSGGIVGSDSIFGHRGSSELHGSSGSNPGETFGQCGGDTIVDFPSKCCKILGRRSSSTSDLQRGVNGGIYRWMGSTQIHSGDNVCSVPYQVLSNASNGDGSQENCSNASSQCGDIVPVDREGNRATNNGTEVVPLWKIHNSGNAEQNNIGVQQIQCASAAVHVGDRSDTPAVGERNFAQSAIGNSSKGNYKNFNSQALTCGKQSFVSRVIGYLKYCADYCYHTASQLDLAKKIPHYFSTTKNFPIPDVVAEEGYFRQLYYLIGVENFFPKDKPRIRLVKKIDKDEFRRKRFQRIKTSERKRTRFEQILAARLFQTASSAMAAVYASAKAAAKGYTKLRSADSIQLRNIGDSGRNVRNSHGSTKGESTTSFINRPVAQSAFDAFDTPNNPVWGNTIGPRGRANSNGIYRDQSSADRYGNLEPGAARLGDPSNGSSRLSGSGAYSRTNSYRIAEGVRTTPAEVARHGTTIGTGNLTPRESAGIRGSGRSATSAVRRVELINSNIAANQTVSDVGANAPGSGATSVTRRHERSAGVSNSSAQTGGSWFRSANTQTSSPRVKSTATQATVIGEGVSASSHSVGSSGSIISGKQAAGIAAGHIISSAIGAAGSVGSSAVQGKAALKMQQSRQDFTRELIGDRQKALESVGLPAYLAYGGNGAPSLEAPQFHTGQMGAGRSIYYGHTPGNSSSVPFTGSPAQLAAGYGNIINV